MVENRIDRVSGLSGERAAQASESPGERLRIQKRR